MCSKKIIIYAVIIVLFPTTGLAQYGPGQYEEEAPLRTWNTLGPITAAYAGFGGSCFARAFDCSAVPVNPALLNKLPKFNLVLNGSLNYVQMNKYGPVNTGVLSSSGNLGLKIYSYDFAGVSYLHGKWGISISQTRNEDYYRPGADYTEYYEGNASYNIVYSQTGGSNSLNLSLSRQINSWLSAGLGINMVKGSLERDLIENYYYSGIIITDQKQHNISGYFINAGLVFDLSEKLTAGLIFRSPYTRKSDSESEYRFQAHGSGTDISISAAEESRFRMPLVLGAGINYSLIPSISLALDISFFNWENYKAEYFGEELTRNFKNILRFNGGIEYEGSAVLFKQAVRIPLRLGAGYDPQPNKYPAVKYTYLSAGAGIRSKHFSLDLGAVLGWERGSGDNLTAHRLIFSIGYRI